MQLKITGRHFEVTDALRQAVESRLEAVFEGKSLKITTASCVLDVEKNSCRADLVVNSKNHDFAASATDFDMYKAIDAAVVKLEAQLAKLIDKVQAHQAPPLREVTKPTEPMPED